MKFHGHNGFKLFASNRPNVLNPDGNSRQLFACEDWSQHDAVMILPVIHEVLQAQHQSDIPRTPASMPKVIQLEILSTAQALINNEAS